METSKRAGVLKEHGRERAVRAGRIAGRPAGVMAVMKVMG
jgi:hypothetical protein